MRPLRSLKTKILKRTQAVITRTSRHMIRTRLRKTTCIRNFSRMTRQNIVHKRTNRQFKTSQHKRSTSKCLRQKINKHMTISITSSINSRLPRPQPITFRHSVKRQTFSRLRVNQLVPITQLRYRHTTTGLATQVRHIRIFNHIHSRHNRQRLLNSISTAPLIRTHRQRRILRRCHRTNTQVLSVQSQLVNTSRHAQRIALRLM